MDAIRKKMQSLKSETDSLYATIQKHEDTVKDANKQNDQHEADVIKLTELREEDKNQQEATRGRMTNLEWRSRGGHSAS